MTKISIIVPVYNVENYLRECLDSLINQTLTDIEIICVDDGSTDNSLAILEEYQTKDSRIKIFTQKNQGVSVARNLGIKKATSEYIFFVDSDDWIDLKACEILYKTAKERNSEILLFSFYKTRNKTFEKDGRLIEAQEKFGAQNTSFKDSPTLFFNLPLQIWVKFYKSDLLLNNNIEFPVNIHHGEDRYFFIKSCTIAKTVSFLNEYLYYYRVDTPNSLTKSSKNSIPHLYQADLLIKDLIYSTIEPKYRNEVYSKFLEKTTRAILSFWNNCYNHSCKKNNLKYLVKLKKEFEKIHKKDKNLSFEYQNLCLAILAYRTLFLRKLFEPLFEIEFRRNRIVLYLFEKQVLNLSTLKLNKFILNLRYFLHLIKCRCCVKYRKLRVAFLITESEKWTSHASIYEAMKNSEHFEPFVLLTYFKDQVEQVSPEEHMKKNIKFLEERGIKYYKAYERGFFYKLKEFKPDIIFYQQPWAITSIQSVLNASKNSLVCYNPYCFHSLKAYVDYLYGFHGYVWKYFVESTLHKKDYEKRYGAKNIVATGSPKIDCYKFLNKEIMNSLWKSKDKKRIIYAPHHAFASELDYRVSTFLENGEFILQLAKKHPETEWIFRPHPVLIQRILRYKVMTLQEIENYYNQWKEVGSIYTGNDYYELFASSDCLITDCISFLAEYLPSEKPVLHLRKNQDIQDKEFNDLVKTITNDYYKIYDNKTLAKTFEEVVLNGKDFLKEKRIKNIALLKKENNETNGQKIVKYLEEQLWIKE